MSFFTPQNPGNDFPEELTQAELTLVQSLAALGDPGADRILFWDESTNAFAYLTAGTGLTISGTTISSTSSSLSGTANEIAYFDTTTSVASLSVVTYPSLAELSYVKGVTSAIQTQLGGKVSTGTTITIAGTANQITSSAGAQDLSANRTWTLSLPSDVLIPAVLTVPNTGLHIFDTNASHDLIIKPGSDLTADKTLTITTGDADVILDLTAVTDEYLLAYDITTNTWRGVAPSSSGANTALSNLASVAINTTLVSDTDNTDALGTATISWSDLFLGSGAVITFSTAPSTPDVTITHSANALTVAGGDLILSSVSLGATGSRVTKGWFTDLEVTNAITGSVTGNAGTASAVAVGGITGLGTNVATALAINVGSAGAFVTLNGVLGTPSSGTVTNLTGTASININGTVGATTPTTGVFTTITANTGLVPDGNDGAYLGQSGTAFSDLFLASGGIINWDTGNATITHSAGLLTSNVDIAVPDEAYGTGWNGSTEVPTKNAVYDKIETLSSPWVVVRKTSDESRNTTTTLTADSTLQFSMAANKIYVIRGMIMYHSASATPDFKYDINGPTIGTGFIQGWAHHTPLNNDTTAPATDAWNTYASTAQSISGTDTGLGFIRFEMWIVNGANAGTWSFRWAQDTSDANNTTVKRGSFIEYIETT